MDDSEECWPNTTSKVSLPPRKICSYLPAAKDALGLRMPGVYSIPCECGKFYIGQIKLMPGNHPKERKQHSERGESLKSRNICFLPIVFAFASWKMFKVG
jgi:hypothetical protein